MDEQVRAARMRTGHARIGQRRALAGVTATWRTTRPGRFGRLKVVDRPATVENLSVTGAGLVLAAEKDDHVGEVVDICLAGAWAKARTVRALPTSTPGLVYWGVEFVTVNGDLLLAINTLLGAEDLMARGILMRD